MITENINAYDKSAKAFDEKIGTLSNYDEAYDFLLTHLETNDEVLDLACGPGNIGRYLVNKIPSLSITGIDLAPAMLEVAKQNVPSGNFICSNITDFIIPTSTTDKSAKQYDVVINGFGLPYLSGEEVVKSFKQSAMHLKKGGIFYISFMEGDKVQKEHPSFNPEITLTVTYHPQKKIESILEDTGFSIIKKYNLDYKESDGSITTDVVLICKL